MTPISNGAPALKCHEIFLTQHPAVEDVLESLGTQSNAYFCKLLVEQFANKRICPPFLADGRG